MALLWRRGAIAAFVVLGLIAAIWGLLLLRPGPDALGVAWVSAGGFLVCSALLLFDGRRFSHVLLFPLANVGLSASIMLHAMAAHETVLVAIVGFVSGISVLATLVAWFSRERQQQQTLADYYGAAIKARRIRHNPAQEALVGDLDTLRRRFLVYESRRRMPWAFLLNAPKGVYLHGAAGQGKSFLLDGMYDICQSRAKQRLHFHDLITAVNDLVNKQPNSARALKRISRQIVDRASLVFIDEVNVLDPATALLFIRVVNEWWRYGCVICISSNQSPDQLFKGVVIPADEVARFFDQLVLRCDVRALKAGEDYRLQKLRAQDLYQHPIEDDTPSRLGEIVELLAEDSLSSDAITVNGRRFTALAHASGVAWFEFDALCGVPASYRDYLALVDAYPNLVVANVPHLDDPDRARRFAWLVEIFYDRRKRLILSAHRPLPDLFAPSLAAGIRDMDFVKIESRLQEMQSSEYDYSLI